MDSGYYSYLGYIAQLADYIVRSHIGTVKILRRSVNTVLWFTVD